MKAAQDPAGGTLWDNTLVLIGNHMEEGANHNSGAIPWMLAGKGGKGLNYGQCVSGSGNGVKAVMAGICKSLGVDSNPYGLLSVPGAGWIITDAGANSLLQIDHPGRHLAGRHVPVPRFHSAAPFVRAGQPETTHHRRGADVGRRRPRWRVLRGRAHRRPLR